jgi:hypothetical protein
MPKITKVGGPSVEPDEPGDPGGPAAAGLDDEPVDEDTAVDETPVQRRPPVNAPKSEHVTYGVDRYGLDPVELDEQYNKADLIKALTALDDGDAHVEQGQVVFHEEHGTDETGPAPTADTEVEGTDGAVVTADPADTAIHGGENNSTNSTDRPES